MWFLYIAEFRGGKLYTGITTEPDRRIREHNEGIGSKALRGKGPVNLVFLEEHPDQNSAAKREAAIKKWSKVNKLKLIQTYRKLISSI